MCVFSLYFKALDRKGVCKVFQNKFSVCLITDKSIMRKKKEQTSSQNYWPAHPKPCNYWWMDVCLCYVCVDSTAHRWVQSVFHAQLQRLEGKDCSHSAYVLLRKFQFLKLFQFKAFSFIAFFSFQTFPWFSGLQSERQSSLTNKQTNKTALRSKFTGVWKLHKQWCPHRHWKYRLNERIVFEHVCACVMFVLGLNIHHVYVF